MEITTEIPGWVGVRDSTLGSDSPVLAFALPEWRAALTAARPANLQRSGVAEFDSTAARSAIDSPDVELGDSRVDHYAKIRETRPRPASNTVALKQ